MLKYNKQHWLIVLVCIGQLASLAIGVAWFSVSMRDRLESTIRRQVLADNQLMASQLAEIIQVMGVSELGYGTSDWQRVQSFIERITLPNEGFLCIIDNQQGQLVCHPKLRGNPAMRDMTPGQAKLNRVTTFANDSDASSLIKRQDQARKGQSILDSVNENQPQATGWAAMPDGAHLIGVRDLPSLDVKVLAHQHEAGIIASVDRNVQAIRIAGLASAAIVTAFTALLTVITVRRYENRLAYLNANLEDLAERRGRSLTKTRDAIIFGLAKLAESRDDETGQHLDRIRSYVTILARQIAKWDPEWDEAAIHRLSLTSSLHDIGKVGIPDAVLCKPGKLTPDERRIMEQHPTIGGDCLLALKQRLGDDDFLRVACEITLSHHERWDGKGYPNGLSGNDIPLSARIVAIADVYDALTTQRVYKPAFSHAQASEIIVEGAGQQFDPALVRIFQQCEEQFRRIFTDSTISDGIGESEASSTSQVPQTV